MLIVSESLGHVIPFLLEGFSWTDTFFLLLPHTGSLLSIPSTLPFLLTKEDVEGHDTCQTPSIPLLNSLISVSIHKRNETRNGLHG